MSRVQILARVCPKWKRKITVRQLLAHQAGLFAFDEKVDRNVVADLDRLAVVLARQKPAWEPGTRQAYHAVTLSDFTKANCCAGLIRAPQPWTVLSRRNRYTTGTGLLYSFARINS